MKPRVPHQGQSPLLADTAIEGLDRDHPLLILASHIGWSSFDKSFSSLFQPNHLGGRPPAPVRLMVSLMMLAYMYNLSDERVVELWAENPYWQSFSGFDFFHKQQPVDPSSLSRWRTRMGTSGVEQILSSVLEAAQKLGQLPRKSLEKVIVDSTVMPKAITYPTDLKLYAKAIGKLVKQCRKDGISLKQSYSRLTKSAVVQGSRSSRQGKKKEQAKQVKLLKMYLARLYREVNVKLVGSSASGELANLLPLIARLLSQTRESKEKLYSLHAPEVSCIAKGKIAKRYEFGSKVSVGITHKEGFVVCSLALSGNPHDSKTLLDTLEHITLVTGVRPRRVAVDLGYRGHGVKDVEVLHPKRKLTKWFRSFVKRRQSIEPHIGHMKQDSKLGRCSLKGALGDKIHALLCAVGYNLRKILRNIKAELFFCVFRMQTQPLTLLFFFAK